MGTDEDVTAAASAAPRSPVGAEYARIRALAARCSDMNAVTALRDLDEALPPTRVVELVDTIQGLGGRLADAEHRARVLGLRAEDAEARLIAWQVECDRRVAAVRADAELANQAVSYALDRGQIDPDFGYYCGPATEVFERLCAAEARRLGEPFEVVRRRRAKSLQPEETKRRPEVEILREQLSGATSGLDHDAVVLVELISGQGLQGLCVTNIEDRCGTRITPTKISPSTVVKSWKLTVGKIVDALRAEQRREVARG